MLTGVNYNTLISTGTGTVLGGFLTVSEGEHGEYVFGIDSPSAAQWALKDLRRFK
ncbi:hypothetical protein D3C80_2131600 [compost metagenome]